MVREILRGDRRIYACEICGFGYADRETAESCEAYCSEHESCSLEITGKAIYAPGSGNSLGDVT